MIISSASLLLGVFIYYTYSELHAHTQIYLAEEKKFLLWNWF